RVPLRGRHGGPHGVVDARVLERGVGPRAGGLRAVGRVAGPTSLLTATDRRPRPVSWWVVGGLVAVALALRLYHLGHTRLWFDETFTAMADRLPLGRVPRFLRAHDVHPPLDYVLRWPFAHSGGSEVLVRLPSVVASTA